MLHLVEKKVIIISGLPMKLKFIVLKKLISLFMKVCLPSVPVNGMCLMAPVHGLIDSD